MQSGQGVRSCRFRHHPGPLWPAAQKRAQTVSKRGQLGWAVCKFQSHNKSANICGHYTLLKLHVEQDADYGRIFHDAASLLEQLLRPLAHSLVLQISRSL